MVPTDPSACDGLTIQPDTVLAQRDGSVNYTRTKTTSGYTVYAVPNYHSLGENKDGQPVCNTTHLCVLYIGQNQLDFTAPHFWSEAFKVSPNSSDDRYAGGRRRPERDQRWRRDQRAFSRSGYQSSSWS